MLRTYTLALKNCIRNHTFPHFFISRFHYSNDSNNKVIKQSLDNVNIANNFNQLSQDITEAKKQKIDSQKKYIQNYSVRCDGCNVRLQSENKEKYGFITQKILSQAIEGNKNALTKAYTSRVKSKDEKIKQFLHEIQKESGITIFNPKTSQMQNLNDLQVIMRLQEKIQAYQEENQLVNRYKKDRKQILCFRCFSLKHHNRLPQQYDKDNDFTTDSTDFILNKVLNRHKEKTVEYFFVVDIFDILGTFQPWLFQKLVEQKHEHRITVIINKTDLVNKKYLNEQATRRVIKKRMHQFLAQIGMQEKVQLIKIFFISCNSSDGISKLKDYLKEREENIQLVGFPNTGKTTLLNLLAKLSKSTSRVPGTTVSITEHSYQVGKKKTIYDMPGLYSPILMYNLVKKPSIRSLLTWHKKISPGILTHEAFFFGGKVEIPDVRIITFINGGVCSSDNRWFLANYRQFWKGLPEPSQLQMQKYEFELEFIDGKTNDLQIAGLGFIGFRLCLAGKGLMRRKLNLYLPKKISFNFRESILAQDNLIFHNKSSIGKKFDLERLHN